MGRLHKMTESQRASLPAEYAAGATLRQLAEARGVDLTNIAYHLRRMGVAARTHKRLSREQRLAATASYDAGESSESIARRYHSHGSTIRYTLRVSGQQMRSMTECHQRLSVNHHAFNNAEANEEAAYWVGFLMADGCVTADRETPRVSLSLAARDKSHVEKFRLFLGAEHALYTAKAKVSRPEFSPGIYFHQPMVQFSVNSRQLAADLARYSVIPRKSLVAKVAILEGNCHFWRGVVDGDGSILIYKGLYNRYASISLSGSLELMEQFAGFVRSVVPRCKAKPNRAGGRIYAVMTTGRFALPVIRTLYANAPVALERKAMVANQLLASCNEHGRLP